MQALVVFLCLAISTAALGGIEVYRWIDAEGQVHYSDRPSPGADRVAIDVAPAGSTPVAGASSAGSAQAAAKKDSAAAAYDSLTIQAPGQDETLWNIGGQLDVAVALQPPLQAGHRVQLLLDGQPVAELEPGTTQTRLSDVYRGQHTLMAKIQDESGSTLIQSAPVNFYVQQSSVARNPSPPVVQPPIRP
ncbi:MAG: DUF4124 domain-containing protein [Gammaproteobacteria bacterium]